MKGYSTCFLWDSREERLQTCGKTADMCCHHLFWKNPEVMSCDTMSLPVMPLGEDGASTYVTPSEILGGDIMGQPSTLDPDGSCYQERIGLGALLQEWKTKDGRMKMSSHDRAHELWTGGQ